MRRVKKALIIPIALVTLYAQLPVRVAAQSGALINPMEGITQNEPQIIKSEEVSFGDNADTGKKSSSNKYIWISAGAIVLAGILLGVSAGGGDDGGSSGETTGDITINW